MSDETREFSTLEGPLAPLAPVPLPPAVPLSPSHPPGWPVVGPYRVQRLIGSGGYGAVYEAAPLAGGPLVALKILRIPDGKPEEGMRERFLCEGQIALGLRDPHLVRYLDVGEHHGSLYIATELMPGGDAAGLLARHPDGLSWITVAAIGRDTARGLAALHAKGLLHRDVKPGNLLLDATGQVKVGDLGLTRHMHDSSGITVAGNVVGTPDFMAPEQARGIPDLDGRADLYGVAATMYWLATGDSPHAGPSVWAVLTALITDPFPDPRKRRPTLPADLALVIRTAGDKERERRHPDAAALATDLEDVLAGRPPRFASAGAAAAEATPPAEGGGPRVLIVDDDPLIRRIYSTRLMMDGYRAEQAADGAAARRAMAGAPPAAVLLDLQLPDADGIDVLRELRARPGWAATPIIVLSNTFAEDRLRLAQEAGATRVLGKGGTGPQAVAALLLEILARPAASAGSAGATAREDLGGLARTALDRIRVLLPDLADGERRIDALRELKQAAHGLAGVAAAAEAGGAAALADATEMLAQLLLERPERITASTRDTVGQAVERLRALLGGRGGRVPDQPWTGGAALVVDDDPMALRLARAALDKVGIRAHCVGEPAAALALLAATRFDLVVTDVMMDGMDGREFARHVRAHPQHHEVPVIYVTASADFAAHADLDRELGEDAIAKPYLLMELAVKALVHRLRPLVAPLLPPLPR